MERWVCVVVFVLNLNRSFPTVKRHIRRNNVCFPVGRGVVFWCGARGLLLPGGAAGGRRSP